MSQVTQITIDNVAFGTFRSNLNDTLNALNSMHSGTSRPASATTGTIWLDTTNAGSNSLTIKFFDGTDDITVADVDTSANTINFIDSTVSTELLTDTTPQLGGVLDTNGNNIEFGDSSGAEVERLKFGVGDDMEIYHDGTNSVILEQGGGDLYIQNNANFEILNEAGDEAKAKFITDGAVELYHNNVKKFETTSSGATVTGTLTATAFSGDGSGLTGVGGGVGNVEAWVNFDGTSNTIRDDGNVSSITDNGTGEYQINFTSTVTADYATIGSVNRNNGTNKDIFLSFGNAGTSDVDVFTLDSGGNLRDMIEICVAIIR